MTRPYISAKLWQDVIQRAENRCEYCCCPMNFSPDPPEVEHIIPTSKKGKTIFDNLALSCRGCNLGKGTKLKAEDKATKEWFGFSIPDFKIGKSILLGHKILHTLLV
jgi:5-methylcytosine-specific restriction endonuclease McrA